MTPWQLLPHPWKDAVGLLSPFQSESLEEMRFRVGRPVMLYGNHWVEELTGPQIPRTVSRGECERILDILVEHSLYAHLDELRQGYVTLPGGHRMGIAGRAVLAQNEIQTITDISGLNIRIARDVVGAAQDMYHRLTHLGLAHGSLLLAAPPRAGKTTIIRDYVRVLSNDGLRVVVVDERDEISGQAPGDNGYDLGLHTDVLQRWPKAEGIHAAVRTLGPDVVVVDELGTQNDLEAVRFAQHAGVRVAATIHASHREDLLVNPWLKPLLDEGVFTAVIFLSRRQGPATVEDIWDTGAVVAL